MLLQIAFDKPEHLALLPQVKPFAGIIEIGTPVLKRVGISAIATARELCPVETVLLTHGSGRASLHTRSGATVSVGIAHAARPIVTRCHPSALVAGIHCRLSMSQCADEWIAGTSPAMTIEGRRLAATEAPLLARGGQY